MTNNIDTLARELLAAEYDADCHFLTAKLLRCGGGGLDHHINQALRAIEKALSTQEERIAEMEGALRRAGERFREYEKHHNAKFRPFEREDRDHSFTNAIAAEKAARNAEMAEMCERALATKEVRGGE